ncbi:oligogalacturonate-specific porin KdgM family protein [Lonsdalea quercina]|uniref:oligogalacturonate-specific porin KdgM family protein n=1 Tax=Lonsdalea quercina TaxID=71657 RepID=UPI003975D32F
MLLRHFLFIPLCVLSFQSQAVSLFWKHEFSDVSRTHSDKFGIEHRFSQGLGLSAEWETYPRESSDGSAGKAFSHLRKDKTELGVDYAFTVSPSLTLTPGITTSIYDEKQTWKPSLSAEWFVVDNIALATRYRYEITDYDDKPTKHTHRIDAGAKYKFSRATLSYKYSRYFSDQPIFAKRDTDYEHQVEMKIKFLTHWQYVLEVTNESVSKSSDKRQTTYATGFKYTF